MEGQLSIFDFLKEPTEEIADRLNKELGTNFVKIHDNGYYLLFEYIKGADRFVIDGSNNKLGLGVNGDFRPCIDYEDLKGRLEKILGENCQKCKYKIWLNKDGKRVRACRLYGSCHFVPAEKPDDLTYDNKGRLYPAPAWMDAERCEKCKNWELAPNQPPDGWGVMGFCTSHRGRGREVNHTSYCDDFEKKEEAWST